MAVALKVVCGVGKSEAASAEAEFETMMSWQSRACVCWEDLSTIPNLALIYSLKAYWRFLDAV